MNRHLVYSALIDNNRTLKFARRMPKPRDTAEVKLHRQN